MNSYMVGRSRSLLFLALSVATLGLANAGTVDVGPVSRSAAANGDGLSFTIANNDLAPSGKLAVFLNGQAATHCAAATTRGNRFAPGGSLVAGDSVQCSGGAGAGIGNETSITVTGSGQGGAIFSHTAHQGYSTNAVPSQASAGILVGAVFNDGNSNNAFDAGETIDYSYTVLNLGNLALTGVTVSDLLGTTISCPGNSLAVGASMECTGTHVITAGEANGAPLSNEAYVVADQSGADSSDSVIRTGTTAAEIRGIKSPLLTQDNDANNVAGEGDVVTYTFAVKNSGSLDLSPVDMTEPDPSRIDGPISCNSTTLGGNAFSGLGSGALVVGDTVLCSATYTITAADVSNGTATNLATITGQPPFGGVASGSAASVFVVPPPPDLPEYKAVPVNGWRAMLLLSLGLLAAAGVTITQRRKRQG